MLTRPQHATDTNLSKGSAGKLIRSEYYDSQQRDGAAMAELNPKAPNFVPGMPGDCRALGLICTCIDERKIANLSMSDICLRVTGLMSMKKPPD